MAQSILLTGATGALGPHILAELLHSETVERVFVVVRPAAEHDPRQRLRDSLRRLAAGTGQPWPSRTEDRLITIAGDVRRDDLALDPQLANQVMREVDVVVHAAANTRFTAPEADLYDVNTVGTWRVLRLASRFRRLRQVLIVSTACVAGTRCGEIRERIDDDAPDFVNAYERTKWQAERLAVATDLPIRIARLSTCIGDGRTGYVHRFGAIHYALRWFMRGLIPMVPAADGACVDVIPTDVAARWLVRAAAQSVERLEVCHLAAGHGAIPIEELLEFVAQHLCATDPEWGRRQIEIPALVDSATFEAFERTALQSGDPVFRRVLESVRSFLPGLLHPKVYQTTQAAACWGGPLPLGDWRLTMAKVIDGASPRRRTLVGGEVAHA